MEQFIAQVETEHIKAIPKKNLRLMDNFIAIVKDLNLLLSESLLFSMYKSKKHNKKIKTKINIDMPTNNLDEMMIEPIIQRNERTAMSNILSIIVTPNIRENLDLSRK